MQLIPKTFVEAIGLNFMHNVISVFVSLPPIPEVTFLPNNLETGVAGCVHVQGTAQVKGFILCRVKVAVLGKHYVNVGLIPNDQIGFLARIWEIIEEQKALHHQQSTNVLVEMNRAPVKVEEEPDFNSVVLTKLNAIQGTVQGIMEVVNQNSQDIRDLRKSIEVYRNQETCKRMKRRTQRQILPGNVKSEREVASQPDTGSC
jgi:hypothetical protein